MDKILSEAEHDDEDALVLRLEDLLPDARGEIVLFADEGAVSVISAAAMTQAGVADGHVTAAGVDVSGLAYCAFDNGITLYYPDHTAVSVSTDVS